MSCIWLRLSKHKKIKRIKNTRPKDSILSENLQTLEEAMICLTPKLVIHTLWMDLKTGTLLFMLFLYFYSSYN